MADAEADPAAADLADTADGGRVTTGLSPVDELVARRAVAGATPNASGRVRRVEGCAEAAAGDGLTAPVAEADCRLVAARPPRSECESRAGDDETDDRAGEAADPSPPSATAVATPGPAKDNPNANAAAPTRAPVKDTDMTDSRPLRCCARSADDFESQAGQRFTRHALNRVAGTGFEPV